MLSACLATRNANTYARFSETHSDVMTFLC